MRVASATDWEIALARNLRTSAWASWACSGVATLPVPIAQTGSYAITIFLRLDQLRVRATSTSYILPVFLLKELDNRLELTAAHFIGLVGLALREGLADAEDDAQAGIESGTSLLGDDLVGLMEECPALGVAGEYVWDTGVVELSRSGERRSVLQITALEKILRGSCCP
jgi:hypothetical protein